MGSTILDGCIWVAASPGSGPFVESGALPGYQTMEAAGAVNQQRISYRAQLPDLSQWEIGFGTWTAATKTLARTTVLFTSLGSPIAINFHAAPQILITALREDLPGGAQPVIPDPTATTVGPTYRPALINALTVYISPTGDDVNGNGTQASPWQTPQRVTDLLYGVGVLPGIDGNGFSVTLKCLDGVYSLGEVCLSLFQPWIGGTNLIILGNGSNPGAVVWVCGDNQAGSCLTTQNIFNVVLVESITFANAHVGASVGENSFVRFVNCVMGDPVHGCVTNHFEANGSNAFISVEGSMTIVGFPGPPTNSHVYSRNNGYIYYQPATLTFATAVAWQVGFLRGDNDGKTLYLPPAVTNPGNNQGLAISLHYGAEIVVWGTANWSAGDLSFVPGPATGGGLNSGARILVPRAGQMGNDGNSYAYSYLEELRVVSDNNNAVAITAASGVVPYGLKLPAQQGRSGAYLQNDGTGVLSWANNFIPAGGSLTFYVSVLSGTIAGGSLYTNGYYNNVPLTGGHGSGAVADIRVTGNAVTAVIPSTKGNGAYLIGDVLSAAAANIGGTGSGFSFTLTAIGNDATSNGQSPSTPFYTVTAAGNAAALYDYTGPNFFAQLFAADGLYLNEGGGIIFPPIKGALNLTVSGNDTIPENCVIKVPGDVIAFSTGVDPGFTGNFFMDGFLLWSTSFGGGIGCPDNAVTKATNMAFSVLDDCMLVNNGESSLNGFVNIYNRSGNCYGLGRISGAGLIDVLNVTINIIGPWNIPTDRWGAFMAAGNGGLIGFSGNTITGAGGVTGYKLKLGINGQISIDIPLSSLPGTIPGQLAASSLVNGLFPAIVKAGAPTTADVPAGTWAVIRDTTNLTTKIYYNNAGTLQSVTLT